MGKVYKFTIIPSGGNKTWDISVSRKWFIIMITAFPFLCLLGYYLLFSGILFEKLEIIEKAIFMAIQINGKIHGIDLSTHLDEIDSVINHSKEKKDASKSKKG